MTQLTRADISRILDALSYPSPSNVLAVDWPIRDLATTALGLMDERDWWKARANETMSDLEREQQERAELQRVAAWRGTMLARYHDPRCSVFSDLPTERALNEGLGVGNDCNCGEQDALVAGNAALREEVHNKADLYVEAKTLYVKAKARAERAEARIATLTTEYDTYRGISVEERDVVEARIAELTAANVALRAAYDATQEGWREAQAAADARCAELTADREATWVLANAERKRADTAEAQVKYEQERNANNVAMADLRIRALEEGLREVLDRNHGCVIGRTPQCGHVEDDGPVERARALLTSERDLEGEAPE